MDKRTVERINGCILRIKNGEYTDAVEELYGYICRPLRIVAVKYFKNTFDVDDAVQSFWAQIDVFCLKCHFFSNGYIYLIKCFESLCKMQLRAEHKKTGRYSVADITLLENVLFCEDPSVEASGLKESFFRAREGMTDQEKLVMSLYVYGEKTVREIADELGVSKSSAGRLVKSVVEKIKTKLIEDGWDKTDE